MKNTDEALCTDSTMEIIDLENWERTEHFNFFQSIKKCNYGTTVQQDVTALYEFRKKTKSEGNAIRFSDLLYFFATKAANGIPEFRTRIVDGRPVIFDVIHPAFTYIPKGRNLHANVLARFTDNFSKQAEYFETARRNSDENPTLTPEGGDKQNLFYFSVVAGVNFTAAFNPWGDCNYDSVPRILFGQMTETESGKKVLPVAVEMLHSLGDGQHLAKFYALFNEMCNDPEKFI